MIEAKGDLDHGDFESMIENDLPFVHRTAHMLRKIASDERLTKGKFTSLLPPSWYTLYQLTKLTDQQFQERIEDGTIRPDMRQADINKVLRLERVEADERRILDLVPVIGKFRTIVIDPAWEYDWLS